MHHFDCNQNFCRVAKFRQHHDRWNIFFIFDLLLKNNYSDIKKGYIHKTQHLLSLIAVYRYLFG